MATNSYIPTVNLPPLTTQLVDKKGMLSPNWVNFFNTLQQRLGIQTTQLGLQTPTMNTAQRNLLPTTGSPTIIYNTDTNKFEAYENNTWVTIQTA